MKKQAVIFDLDGTLLNTIDDLADSGNRALRSLGLKTFPVDDYYRFVGKGLDVAISRILDKAGADPGKHAELKRAFQHHYDRLKRNKTRPYPNIRGVLRRLDGQSVTLAVLSNKNHADTVDVVRHFFPDIPFAEVFGKKDGFPIKPDPSSLIAMLKTLDLDRKEVLYVGDTATDMKTAKSAGVTAIGVLWGFRDADELNEAGADRLIDDPKTLLTLVKGEGEK